MFIGELGRPLTCRTWKRVWHEATSALWPGDDERIRSVMDGALVALTDQARTEEVVPKRPRRSDRVRVSQAFLVSQKIVEISSILASSWSATSSSNAPLVPPAPASLVASLKSWCSWGYFSKCGALK